MSEATYYFIFLLEFFLEDSQLYIRLGKAHVLGEAKENNALIISKMLPLLPFYYCIKDAGLTPSTLGCG